MQGIGFVFLEKCSRLGASSRIRIFTGSFIEKPLIRLFRQQFNRLGAK